MPTHKKINMCKYTETKTDDKEARPYFRKDNIS